jgi:hypothetical protein
MDKIIKDRTPWKEVPLPSTAPYYEMLPKYYKEHRAI